MTTPSGHIVSGLDVTWIMVSIPSTNESLVWTLVQDSESAGSAPSFRETSVSINVS